MRVGVVGAGITGLALTHYLAEQGVESVAFDAASEAGGVISTREVDGHVLERGPQRLRKTPGLTDLARAAGIEDDIVEAREADLYVYADGSLCRAPLSAEALARTDLLSWRGKARLLAEPLTAPGHPAETVADLFTRKFGREAYERFVGPLYGGLYGSDPAEMPAAFALEGLLEREAETGSLLRALNGRLGGAQSAPPITFEAGNQQLPVALAETYDDRVTLGTPVTGVEPANGQVTDGGVTVTGSAGDDAATGTGGYVLHTPEGSHRVDALVVTTPAGVTAELLAAVAPEAGCLDELRYNRLAMVFMESGFDRDGKGYQVGYGEALHTLGVSWNASLFDREGLYTAFLGGMFDPELVDLPDHRLATIATREFERVTGASATAVDVTRVEPGYPAWDQSWWALEDIDLPADVHLATNYTARMGVPGRVREARDLAESLAADG